MRTPPPPPPPRATDWPYGSFVNLVLRRASRPQTPPQSPSTSYGITNIIKRFRPLPCTTVCQVQLPTRFTALLLIYASASFRPPPSTSCLYSYWLVRCSPASRRCNCSRQPTTLSSSQRRVRDFFAVIQRIYPLPRPAQGATTAWVNRE